MMMMMEEEVNRGAGGGKGEQREFLAVLLAGFGNSLVPLTNSPSLKCLLPIGNKAMIDYTLEWLSSSSSSSSSSSNEVSGVLIVCPTMHRQALTHHVHSDLSPALSSLHIEIQTYDETPESMVGTAVLLRHVANRIQQDFVLLPCDFIPPSLSSSSSSSSTLQLSTLLNQFRVDSTDGGLVTSTWFAPSTVTEESGRSPMVWDEKTKTLLYVDSLDDQDRNGDELELKMSVLSKHPRARMSKKFQDSHVYVCKRSILDVLTMKPHFDSFREEFLPWLCTLQHASKSKKAKYAAVLAKSNMQSQDIALRRSTLYNVRQNHSHADQDDEEEEEEEKKLEPTYRIGLVLHRGPEIASRVNTIEAFIEVNRQLASKSTWVLPSDPTNRALIDQKAQISSDCIIGDSTQISERSTIKKSVIGKHCVIGRMARITGCVVMDHCVVEEGAKVDGCVLGAGTRVGEKGELSKCVTQPGFQVEKGSSWKGEKLEVSDWTEGGDEEEEEESSEEGTVQDDESE